MEPDHGIFTVSLDFELYWGVRDKRTIEGYGENLRGVQQAIPEILRVFRGSDIHATWATVGFLFFDDAADLKRNLPVLRPTYQRPGLSPYAYIESPSRLEAMYHFAPALIDRISQQEGQEIGTHTFSHYYCLEQGQSLEQFEEDMAAAMKIGRRNGYSLKSIVFPRNQCNSQYLSVLSRFGVECYRGTQASKAYEASDQAGQRKLQRALRLADAYLNISGHNTHALQECLSSAPFNFPASSFLRPYARKWAFLDRLRLRRIKDAMTFAAVKKRIYHLWWHPHNFGRNTGENIAFLQGIADHHDWLKARYGFASMNMGELCALGREPGLIASARHDIPRATASQPE
jgi:peptidoglycan/xylan/chitin deacetylase (PgdA/CDA1 family)